jgi:hypothetical protein
MQFSINSGGFQMSISIKKIGESLMRAGMLEIAPLCVYFQDEIPQDAVPMVSVDKCAAKAILTVAMDKNTPALYIGPDCLKGFCLGGITWLGFSKKLSPHIKYFVSTGHEDFRGGDAEYLKASPELFEKFAESIGPINLPRKNLVVKPCDKFSQDEQLENFEGGPGIKDPIIHSLLCFGNGQQIRNLCSLIHFRTINPFESIICPFGPACATMITYPAHLAEKTPTNAAFIGPTDPTGNRWFPTDFMALGIPLNMAKDMCNDLENSFAVQRPEVAYPQNRDNFLQYKQK